MIRVSNLRKEHLPDSGECRIACDIESPYSQSRLLWFSVPEQYGDWLTDDVYDAFMVAMLFPAMFHNDSVTIDGCVSEHLYDRITNYIQKCEIAHHDYLHEVDVTVKGFSVTQKKQHLVGCGFTAGIDAFSTVYDRFVLEKKESHKISALFFFNVGTHGGGTEKARRKFHTRYDYLKPLTQELGLPFVPMDSNLFDFYRFEWEFDAGIFCRNTAILVFQKVLSRYYIAYDYSYWEITHMTETDYGAVTDICNDQIFGTESLELVVDGAQYRRSEKIERLLDFPPFYKYLNVCVSARPTPDNCSVCHKCLRTELALDILNRLDEFRDVFDIEKFKSRRFKYKCQTVVSRKTDIYSNDNCALAQRMGYPMPPYIIAWLYCSPRLMRSWGRRLLDRFSKS